MMKMHPFGFKSSESPTHSPIWSGYGLLGCSVTLDASREHSAAPNALCIAFILACGAAGLKYAQCKHALVNVMYLYSKTASDSLSDDTVVPLKSDTYPYICARYATTCSLCSGRGSSQDGLHLDQHDSLNNLTSARLPL